MGRGLPGSDRVKGACRHPAGHERPLTRHTADHGADDAVLQPHSLGTCGAEGVSDDTGEWGFPGGAAMGRTLCIPDVSPVAQDLDLDGVVVHGHGGELRRDAAGGAAYGDLQCVRAGGGGGAARAGLETQMLRRALLPFSVRSAGKGAAAGGVQVCYIATSAVTQRHNPKGGLARWATRK